MFQWFILWITGLGAIHSQVLKRRASLQNKPRERGSKTSRTRYAQAHHGRCRLRAAGSQGGAPGHCTQLTAAAEAAAQRTASMVCRIGRASRLGDRTLGHPDPGAVSFSIMMRAFEKEAG